MWLLFPVDLSWNTSRVLSDYLLRNPSIYRKKTVLELGAGAGLPGLVSAVSGAEAVVITDYPDHQLVDNLRWNVECNVPELIRDQCEVDVSLCLTYLMIGIRLGSQRETFAGQGKGESCRWIRRDYPQRSRIQPLSGEPHHCFRSGD